MTSTTGPPWATGPVWFQLYVYRDRAITRDLVARVEAAGCQALVLTADAAVLGTLTTFGGALTSADNDGECL